MPLTPGPPPLFVCKYASPSFVRASLTFTHSVFGRAVKTGGAPGGETSSLLSEVIRTWVFLENLFIHSEDVVVVVVVVVVVGACACAMLGRGQEGQSWRRCWATWFGGDRKVMLSCF